MKAIESVLPKHMDIKRFMRMAANCLMKNPDLKSCNPASFALAVMNCAEMGLAPTLGEAALVPYKGIVQAMPMYQGILKLARMSGQVGMIFAECVYEGDDFAYEMGLNPTLKHVPSPKRTDKSKVIWTYAVAKLKDGNTQFVVMSEEEIDKVRKSSPASGSKMSPWNTWPDEMRKKTAIKRLAKMLPKSTEMQRAIDIDNAIVAGKIDTPAAVEQAEISPELAEFMAEQQQVNEGQIAEPKAKTV
jgi:recombination protein RecT